MFILPSVSHNEFVLGIVKARDVIMNVSLSPSVSQNELVLGIVEANDVSMNVSLSPSVSHNELVLGIVKAVEQQQQQTGSRGPNGHGYFDYAENKFVMADGR